MKLPTQSVCPRTRAICFALAIAFALTPGRVRADYPATVDPSSVLVTNFQGWGTSLCWWANVVGSYPNRTNFVDLAFRELQLNIVRYNIGGGQNPAISASKQGYRTLMPGFEPRPGGWNWNVDENQRWVLQAALARGANLVDAFANSPPWWMCVSSNVDGASGGTNNLQEACEDSFAAYLATVVRHLTLLDHVHFDYVTPMNEPSGGWSLTRPSQEGCHMSRDQQARVINSLQRALQANQSGAGIDAPEDYDEYDSYSDLRAYGPFARDNIALITTHTYKANDAVRLSALTASLRKPLWVSEYGDNDGSGLTMARRIHDDITSLKAQAWIYWQVVDSSAGWGFLYNPLARPFSSGFTTNYTINQKFYVMAQFSKFIRPGCEIISSGDPNTLAAYTPASATLVLVAVNPNRTIFDVTYDLGRFGDKPWQAAAWLTAPGENLVPLPPPAVNGRRFNATLPGRSVTTFVLSLPPAGSTVTNPNGER